MNEGLKIENIQKIANELDVELNNNFVYGYVDAKMWKYSVSNLYGVLSMKHYIIVFGKEKLVLIGLTIMGDLANEVQEVMRKDIDEISFKLGLLQGKLKLRTDDETTVFKIGKKIAGVPWQKANIEYLMTNEFQ